MTKGARANGKASMVDRDEWCADYHGKLSRRKRYTDFELAVLKRRCGLEDK